MVSRMPNKEEGSVALIPRLHLGFSRVYPEGPYHTSQRNIVVNVSGGRF